MLASSALCSNTLTNTSNIAATAVSPAGSLLKEGTSVAGNPGYVFKPNLASTSNAILPCANLSITKTNNVSALQAGQTVVYDIAVANGGPSGANNAVFTDPVAAGLVCTSVACTAAIGLATCPLPGNVTIGLLQSGGILRNNFPASSSLTSQVTCGVQ